MTPTIAKTLRPAMIHRKRQVRLRIVKNISTQKIVPQPSQCPGDNVSNNPQPIAMQANTKPSFSVLDRCDKMKLAAAIANAICKNTAKSAGRKNVPLTRPKYCSN